MMNGSLLGIIAREVMGRPDAHVASFEMLDMEHDGFDGVKVVLIDAPPCLTGKRKGLPNWHKATNRQPRLFSWHELETLKQEWAERTGLCIPCAGTGREFVRWHVDEGTTFRACKPCNGTGSADGVTVAPTREPIVEAVGLFADRQTG